MATLEGLVALVTGGGRGIGRACALDLAARGVKVAVAARTRAEVDAVAAELGAKGVQSLAVELDVADPTSVARAVEATVAALGPIDLLVNNAGVAPSAPFEKTDLATWQLALAVNLTGTFLCTQAVIRGMVERGFGRVVNVASIAGKVGYPYVSAYCASKHGVVGLTKAVALEVATKGVTVNAVCPGYVSTKLVDDAIARIASKTGRPAESARAHLASASPQGRLLEADEVARLVVFLCEPGSGGINGQSINLDGGGVTS